jgi:hypothetical protein
MVARFHRPKHISKLLEIDALLGFQRVLFEERDDVRRQMLSASDSKSHSRAVVSSNDTTTEERLQRVQKLHIALVLHDGEFRQNLNAEFHVGVRIDPDVKTAFTIHETCDPFCV